MRSFSNFWMLLKNRSSTPGFSCIGKAIPAGAIWAANVIDTDMGEPGNIVQARKAAMQAIKLNMDDAKVKAKNKDLKSIQANAMAVDALARVLPPLYKDAHKGAYDGTGVFYKGAPPMEIEKMSNEMSDAAQMMGSGAAKEDGNLINAGIGKVYQTWSSRPEAA